jgi:hypothetical protein
MGGWSRGDAQRPHPRCGDGPAGTLSAHTPDAGTGQQGRSAPTPPMWGRASRDAQRPHPRCGDRPALLRRTGLCGGASIAAEVAWLAAPRRAPLPSHVGMSPRALQPSGHGPGTKVGGLSPLRCALSPLRDGIRAPFSPAASAQPSPRRNSRPLLPGGIRSALSATEFAPPSPRRHPLSPLRDGIRAAYSAIFGSRRGHRSPEGGGRLAPLSPIGR